MPDFVETVARPVPPLSAYATKMDVSLVLAHVVLILYGMRRGRKPARADPGDGRGNWQADAGNGLGLRRLAFSPRLFLRLAICRISGMRRPGADLPRHARFDRRVAISVPAV